MTEAAGCGVLSHSAVQRDPYLVQHFLTGSAVWHCHRQIRGCGPWYQVQVVRVQVRCHEIACCITGAAPAFPAGEVFYMSDADSHRIQEEGVLTVREAADQGYENMGRSRGGPIG